MNGFRVTPLETSKEDERGWTRQIEAMQAENLAIYFRKKGSTCGNHYHKGNSPSRTPERGICLSGKMRMTCRDLETNEEETIDIGPNTLWEIDPNIFHIVEILEDTTFIERTHPKDPDDYFRLDNQ